MSHVTTQRWLALCDSVRGMPRPKSKGGPVARRIHATRYDEPLESEIVQAIVAREELLKFLETSVRSSSRRLPSVPPARPMIVSGGYGHRASMSRAPRRPPTSNRARKETESPTLWRIDFGCTDARADNRSHWSRFSRVGTARNQLSAEPITSNHQPSPPLSLARSATAPFRRRRAVRSFF